MLKIASPNSVSNPFSCNAEDPLARRRLLGNQHYSEGLNQLS